MKISNISFNGIKNISVHKKEYDKYGPYVTNNGNIKNGDKHYTEVKINCKLTDDSDGQDLRQFHEALKKSGMRYQANCIDKDNPQHIELKLIRQDIKDSMGHISNSDLLINNFDILLNEKETLPMFSYMAHLTRKIANLPNTSDAQKYYTKLVNKSVDEEARRFLDLY